ncbi:MAG: adenosylcobinamide-GDP ribazoletransferase, partial [Alphaproteobacteria bacterium]
ARALRVFPVIGAAIGAAGGLVLVIAAALDLPPLAAALLALGAIAVLTGALHEDGLADAADGFGAGRDAADTVAIMRDGRIGAYGALALVGVVGLKVAALAALTPGAALLALAAAGAGSRAAIAAIAWMVPPARPDGLGAALGRPADAAALVALGTGTLAAIVLIGPAGGAVALVAAAIVAGALAWLAQRRIGGYTGDVLGAIQQMTETTMLLAAAAMR